MGNLTIHAASGCAPSFPAYTGPAFDLLIGVIVILSVILVGLVVFGIALLVKGRDRTKKKTSKKKKKERKKKNKGMRR
ncbi:hypothetical protein Y032_0155g3072 [Ancylostoma ceylanicum]|uniref:Uncharacterized protein n=1 Tax=Ancylostoma ceylanicum TaxID=53326 RepID=A0A016SYP2_9BILA|nr:hypothetical protein Y032_0155g3072 [Ancylostoma ceylanicum]